MASARQNIAWGSDVPISMPAPLREGQVPHVDMGGFCFTVDGLAHFVHDTDLEAYLFPMYAPPVEGLAGEVPQ